MTGTRIVVRCPAKVNLHLEVGALGPDGFHEVRTLYQAIDLHDVLVFAPAHDLTLSCDDPAVPSGNTNLVLQAAQRLRRHFGLGDRGAAISLRKAIPAGGGLGGGSSNAAGALVGLARLWGLAPAREELEGMAAGIGSDVTFFLHGGTAEGSGRGERIVVRETFAARSLVLGVPPFGIATAEVYRRLDAARAGARSTPLTRPAGGVSLAGLLYKFSEENDFGLARNDLQQVVVDGWPEVGTFREDMIGTGAKLAMVSGSGSTVFGVFEDESCAARAARALAERHASWIVVPTTSVSWGVHVVSTDRAGTEEGDGP